MRIHRVKDLLELFVELNEVAINTSECFKLVHAVELLINLVPLDVIKPVCWVWLLLDSSTWSGEEESPLRDVNLIVSK